MTTDRAEAQVLRDRADAVCASLMRRSDLCQAIGQMAEAAAYENAARAWATVGAEEPATATPPEQWDGLVRVRIAVAVNAFGVWFAWGRARESDGYAEERACALLPGPRRVSWVEAWVPLPVTEGEPIEGEVSP